MRNLMKMNPVLAWSICHIPGPQTIRVVLTPEAVNSIRPFLGAICRIRVLHETKAYELGSGAGDGFYTWVERGFLPEDCVLREYLVHEIRRPPPSESNLPRIVSMAELKHEELGTTSCQRPTGPHIEECVLHLPDPIPSERMFDIGCLADLPPDGYPLSGTPLEAIRNMLVKRDPGSRARQWAARQRGIYLREFAEERLANRVLANEQKFNFDRE